MMAFRDFVEFAVVGAIVALAAAVHSPYAKSLAAIWLSVSP
jgi:hypothetical protein